MKFKINNSIVLLTVLTLSAFGFACSSKKDKGTEETKIENIEQSSDAAHTEEDEDTTSLTPEQMDAVGITLGNIENKNMTAVIKANGTLRVPNKNRANATSLYGGVIKTLNVELGDYVRKGQVIATIENPQFILLQEEFLSLESSIVLAEQELERQKELNAGNAGAKKNLQDATSKLSALRTKKASLLRQIQMMGINPGTISTTNLKNILAVSSPINGNISNVYAKVGSYVDVTFPLVEIIDNSMMHVDMQVFEKDIPNIKIGQRVNFVVTNNPAKNYTATVFNIGSSFENDGKSIAVHSAIEGEKNGLIDGMNIVGTLDIDDTYVTAVPNEALVDVDGKTYIFVHIDKGDQAPHKKEEHLHKEGDDHDHTNEKEHVHPEGEKHDHSAESKDRNGAVNFKKYEVIKGTSYMGYTAITAVSELPPHIKIVTKGAFFILAKMNDTGGHEH
ncbi:efflux RND transporter periplasmic adaptor subunit [Sphingobacterium sp. UT-1RO-CII-1]|uniref:efflux RND transporter periplasmic adaptor subunit n=1 Tax=Sphingobacterium sp. UT-1RO-CII-1 TaxID=2995225 RepID=UPI00227AD77E|nr:efflux RND transporter periplasmic adaptor subunit [Sphingobacterium sp. UT-1RO-CII-1]MCY4779383.1 efflux RND transporter periplasmic adaptor subunit [Sphingobacterium sp. UT-1RO-CII-1]